MRVQDSIERGALWEGQRRRALNNAVVDTHLSVGGYDQLVLFLWYLFTRNKVNPFSRDALNIQEQPIRGNYRVIQYWHQTQTINGFITERFVED